MRKYDVFEETKTGSLHVEPHDECRDLPFEGDWRYIRFEMARNDEEAVAKANTDL